MNRRVFLSVFGSAAAAAVIDPAELLWTRKKLISIPKPLWSPRPEDLRYAWTGIDWGKSESVIVTEWITRDEFNRRYFVFVNEVNALNIPPPSLPFPTDATDPLYLATY